MLKLLIAWLLIGLYGNVNGLPEVSEVPASLANIILKSSYSMEDSPALTASCFQLYSPKLIDLTKKFQDDQNVCLNQTAEKEHNLDDQLKGTIETIKQNFDSMNSHFEKCANTTDSLYNLLECYNNAAGFTIDQANDLQILSKNKMKYVEITEEYISYNQSLCTDTCYQSYNEESMKTHTDLENCLNGIYVTESSSTSSSSKKPEPEETTVETSDKPVAPAVDEPIPSENPQSSTERMEMATSATHRKKRRFSKPF